MSALLLALLAAGPFPQAIERSMERCITKGAEAWAPITVAAVTEATIAGNAGYARYHNADGDVTRSFWSVPPAWDGASDLTMTVYFLPDTSNTVDNGETIVFDCQWQKLEGVVHTVASCTATYTQTGTGSATAYLSVDITIDHDDVNNALEPCRVVNGIQECDVFAFGLNHDETNSTYNGGTSSVYVMGATLCAR